MVCLVNSLERQLVEMDLRYGYVTGYSPYIKFLNTPQHSENTRCDSQAVIRIDFSGMYKTAKLQLEYMDRPRLWTLDISDSPFGNGYGGDNGTSSNMAEAQILNKQMRIFGNSLPGFMDASINGGLLMKVVDNFVRKGSKVLIDIADERMEWHSGAHKDYIESKFLFTLRGQNTTYGGKDPFLYVAFNRVVAAKYRSGSGLCKVTVTLQKGNESK